MALIDLSPEEVTLLRASLDSYAYWEHRDELPHGSGFIYDPDNLDPDEYDIEELKSSEAWKEVQAALALDERLAVLEGPDVDENP